MPLHRVFTSSSGNVSCLAISSTVEDFVCILCCKVTYVPFLLRAVFLSLKSFCLFAETALVLKEMNLAGVSSPELFEL